VRFYRVVKGKRQQLAGADIKVLPNVWHTLAVKAQGDRFSISYDAKRCSRPRTTPSAVPAR
jgi:hypothetical protein